jgi:hypothetical protein
VSGFQPDTPVCILHTDSARWKPALPTNAPLSKAVHQLRETQSEGMGSEGSLGSARR